MVPFSLLLKVFESVEKVTKSGGKGASFTKTAMLVRESFSLCFFICFLLIHCGTFSVHSSKIYQPNYFKQL